MSMFGCYLFWAGIVVVVVVGGGGGVCLFFKNLLRYGIDKTNNKTVFKITNKM